MSKVAEEKRNWLEEVKADSEALTRKRLQEELPKMEQEVAARQSRKNEIKEAREAGVKFANVPPTQPIESDGQPDQGEIMGPDGNKQQESEEVKRLKAELKAARTQNTRLENKLQSKAKSEEAPKVEDEEIKASDEQKEGAK